ncbi:MAG: hypothetical protein M1826_004918 [Phylliscum demangeonii]|nr:MAG: hypothetical protein M1826_004918 [Phylliscum demangeonii]
MAVMNIFRILGDVSHTLSKCILIVAIHRNHSAEGVSLITQALYGLVFVTRYLDLLSVGSWTWWRTMVGVWNVVLKNFYIWSSLYIVAIMWRWYPRSREREKAWRVGAWSLVASAVLAPAIAALFDGKEMSVMETFWAFSQILESVCVLPQLLLLRQTNVPTVIDSYYLLTLGSYRAFYIANWIVRALDPHDHPSRSHAISIIFGVVQTALYLDFAWVYWSRQRVKLRAGGVVDAEDMRHGWLLRGLLGRRNGLSSTEDDDDAADGDVEGAPPPRARAGGRWGARGISVSADDDLSSPAPMPPAGIPRPDEAHAAREEAPYEDADAEAASEAGWHAADANPENEAQGRRAAGLGHDSARGLEAADVWSASGPR